MKKNVFRSNYSNIEKLQENIRKNMETAEERNELDKAIDKAQGQLNKAMQDAKDGKIASNVEQDAETPLKETKKKNKKVDLDD